MTSGTVTFLLTALAAFSAGADDPWAKVRELKSGTECRILRTGARQPIAVKIDEATDESLIVVLKNEQAAIPKDEIERIECRPPSPGSRLKPETKVETTQQRTRDPNSLGPTKTISSGLTLGGGKPDFEVVYRRTPAAPKK